MWYLKCRCLDAKPCESTWIHSDFVFKERIETWLVPNERWVDKTNNQWESVSNQQCISLLSFSMTSLKLMANHVSFVMNKHVVLLVVSCLKLSNQMMEEICIYSSLCSSYSLVIKTLFVIMIWSIIVIAMRMRKQRSKSNDVIMHSIFCFVDKKTIKK